MVRITSTILIGKLGLVGRHAQFEYGIMLTGRFWALMEAVRTGMTGLGAAPTTTGPRKKYTFYR